VGPTCPPTNSPSGTPDLSGRPGEPSGTTRPPTNAPIAWSDLGAKATAQYSGDGLSVAVTPSGAVRLRCTFQKLEGEVTCEGLWLESTVPGAAAVPAEQHFFLFVQSGNKYVDGF
ncbi:MAG: hypothetical protein NTV54_06215, partial [Ignavibacteriales bacterium]|nr:hypothetical protein [Ignavibacteriales bacterium]